MGVKPRIRTNTTPQVLGSARLFACNSDATADPRPAKRTAARSPALTHAPRRGMARERSDRAPARPWRPQELSRARAARARGRGWPNSPTESLSTTIELRLNIKLPRPRGTASTGPAPGRGYAGSSPPRARRRRAASPAAYQQREDARGRRRRPPCRARRMSSREAACERQAQVCTCFFGYMSVHRRPNLIWRGHRFARCCRGIVPPSAEQRTAGGVLVTR